MRPGRPGRSAHPGCAADGRHGLTPPELGRSLGRIPRPNAQADRTALGRRISAHVADAGRRARAARQGRGRRAGVGVDRRQERRPARRRRPASSERAGDLLAANHADLEAAEAAGHRSRVRSTGCASPTPASRAWPTACARSPRCPTRSARCSTAGAAPTGSRSSAVRVPLGVVAIIYENRPNVTSDAAGLCLKSGNAALLRGSRRRCARTSPSPRCCATASPRPGCPRTR